MKLGKIKKLFEKQKPKPVVSSDSARIQRERDYEKKLGKTRLATKRLQERINKQQRGSFCE